MKNFSSDEILEALNKYYHESIFVSDGEGNIIYVNELGANRLGVNREHIMNKNVRQLIDEGVYGQSTTLMAIKSKEEVIATLSPDNEASTVSHSVPVLDENGDVIMVVTNNMSIEHSKEWNNILANERIINERLQRELDYLKQQVDDDNAIITQSIEMKNIYNTINVIAPTDSNIIILGESGTGKDVMARYIHEHSQRKDCPYISINCSAIPETLLESELFGYVGGAFSGALSKGKIGLFEAATGGTVFLDEIGDMPLALQAKLLRTIENNEIRRVGGVKNIPIDVRVICATNKNLTEMMKKNDFREDLYYRLSVFTINLPPLRDREEDILPMAEFFLKKLNEKYDTNKYFSDITIDTLKKHSWPGNIRELRNVVERIFVVSQSDALYFTPIPKADIQSDNKYENNDRLEIVSLKEAVKNFEYNYIQRVISENNGSVNDAAAVLGVHRSAIYRKLKKEE